MYGTRRSRTLHWTMNVDLSRTSLTLLFRPSTGSDSTSLTVRSALEIAAADRSSPDFCKRAANAARAATPCSSIKSFNYAKQDSPCPSHMYHCAASTALRSAADVVLHPQRWSHPILGSHLLGIRWDCRAARPWSCTATGGVPLCTMPPPARVTPPSTVAAAGNGLGRGATPDDEPHDAKAHRPHLPTACCLLHPPRLSLP